MRHYKLTDETITLGNGTVLHRIECVEPIPEKGINVGDKGGYIENEDNLSGNAWVSGKACVYGSARVSDNACVSGNARVYGSAWVSDNAEVSIDARVYGNAWVSGKACVSGNAHVYGKAIVCDNAHVYGNAKVYDRAGVYDKAWVYGEARVYGNARVSGNAWVYDNAWVYGEARVSGKACVSDNAEVSGNAIINTNADYIVFKNWWSSLRYFTWTRSNNKWCVGCFYGTGEELIAKAYKDSDKSGREYERVVRYVESILENEKEIQ